LTPRIEAIVAVSEPLAILYGVAWLALIATAGTITWLKGRRAEFFIGVLVAGLVWVVAACFPAKPNSWWARRNAS